MSKPYKAVERNGYWICIDLRNGHPASYPTSKSGAQADARFMNKCYTEALAA